jgi:hypothetical protein
MIAATTNLYSIDLVVYRYEYDGLGESLKGLMIRHLLNE